MQRYCPSCGGTGGPFVRNLCLRCFVERYGLVEVPRGVELTACKYCGGFLVQGRWVRGLALDEVLHSVLRSRVKPSAPEVAEPEVEQVELEGRSKARVLVSASVAGARLSKEYLVEVRLRRGICPSCARGASKTWEALIQVRGGSGRVSAFMLRELGRLLETLPVELRESIVDVEEVRGGVDLKFADAGAARLVASKIRRELMAKTVETHKLVGRRSDGKPKTKVTISVRLPDVTPGDLLVLDSGEVVLVEGLRSGRLMFKRGDGRRGSLGWDDVWSKARILRKLGPGDSVHAMVMSVTPNAIVFLAMEGDYRVMEYHRSQVRVLSGELKEGATVLLYPLGDKVYVVSGS